jgi:hypothetical protein
MPNGGRGHRWMYRLTGLPGWMRFGFSPGWMGMSPTGLGPGASYLMTGQWPTPQAQAYWEAMQAGQAPYPSYGGAWAMPFYGGSAPPPGTAVPRAPQMTPEQEMEFLRNQAQMMGEQLEHIQKRLQELEGE